MVFLWFLILVFVPFLKKGKNLEETAKRPRCGCGGGGGGGGDEKTPHYRNLGVEGVGTKKRKKHFVNIGKNVFKRNAITLFCLSSTVRARVPGVFDIKQLLSIRFVFTYIARRTLPAQPSVLG